MCPDISWRSAMSHRSLRWKTELTLQISKRVQTSRGLGFVEERVDVDGFSRAREQCSLLFFVDWTQASNLTLSASPQRKHALRSFTPVEEVMRTSCVNLWRLYSFSNMSTWGAVRVHWYTARVWSVDRSRKGNKLRRRCTVRNCMFICETRRSWWEERACESNVFDDVKGLCLLHRVVSQRSSTLHHNAKRNRSTEWYPHQKTRSFSSVETCLRCRRSGRIDLLECKGCQISAPNIDSRS